MFGSLESNFLSSLYILDINPQLDVGLVKIFSQSVDYHFVLLTESFALQKVCNFMRSHLSIFDLRTQAIAYPVLCLGNLPCAPVLKALPHILFF